MGTRHLTIVIEKEKPVVAQYGQWDGYPAGQGRDVLNFLKTVNMDRFKKRLKQVRFFNEKDESALKKFMKEIGAEDGWLDMDQAAMYHKKYPFLSRNNGADILTMITESKGKVVLRNSLDFASDSLFCEWAYLIDLDKNVLEVYEGFNHQPLEEGQRFKDMPLGDYSGMDQYYPIRCVKTYPLDNLPTDEDFVKELEPKEEEEEK
jgi:hypothetical protein